MNYEETVELEENVRIKNVADELYKMFLKNVNLYVEDYLDGMFCVWRDSHNTIYISINSSHQFVFHCRFLHESYNLIITPNYIFNAIKNKSRVVDHFESFVKYGK